MRAKIRRLDTAGRDSLLFMIGISATLPLEFFRLRDSEDPVVIYAAMGVTALIALLPLKVLRS